MTAELTSDDLTRFGEDGWELVAVQWDGAAIRAAVLKRPRTREDDDAREELA